MRTELWHRIEPIVDAALDLSEDERDAYLEAACAGDSALRREVESLVAECEASESFLSDMAGAVDAARSDALDGGFSWIDRRFGVYRAVDVLGSGGMGTVLLAERDDGLFEQSVAIKVVDRRLGAAGRARFAYERQILADLEHPHIARLLDGGVTDEGLPYLVMERVEGVPLDTFVEEAPEPYSERRALDRVATLRLLAKIARAVDHAHRCRVVHLDLKPSNLLITVGGEPKLLDFGIAEILDPERRASGRPEGDDAGSSRMTPAYAAPEQLRGERVTSACDVYALGVLLYRLLTGELPFDPADQRPEAFVRRVSEEPAPPPSRHVAGIDPDLDAITVRALAKTPEDRYPSAAALADDLERFLAFEPVSAMPPRVGYLLRRHVRRHWRAWASGLVAALSILGLGLGWAIEERRADQRVAVAQRFGSEAERIEGFLRYAYALPEHDVRRETGITRRRMARIERQMAELGSLAEGPGHVALGRGWASLGDTEQAVEHLERAWAAGERGPDVAFALGRALAERYGEERSAALRLRDPALRANAVERAETRYRARALDVLGRAEATELGSPALLDGLVALVEDRLDAAVEHARAATDATPWSPAGAHLEGEALGRRGQEEAAAGEWSAAEADFAASLASLAAAAELAPSDAGLATERCAVHRARVEMERLRKRFDDSLHPDAVAACERASRIDPDRVEPALHRAYLHLYRLQDPTLDSARRRDHAERAGAILTSLAARVDDPAVDQSLGTFHLSRAVLLVRPEGGDPRPDLETAVDSLRRSIAADPGRVDAYVNLGTALAIAADEEAARGGDAVPLYRAAADRFGEALDRVGDHVPVRHNLSTMLFREAVYRWSRGEDPRPQLRRSLELCEATLALNPSLPAALNHRAAVLEELARVTAFLGESPAGAYQRARAALDAVRQAHPDYLLPWVNTVSLETHEARWRLVEGETPEPALQRARAALDRADALGGAGVIFFHVNRAELHLTRAAWSARDPGAPVDVATELAAVRDAVDAGLRVDPNDPLLHLAIARAAARARRAGLGSPSLEDGRAAIEAILAVRPDHVPARAVGAELAWIAGDPAAARQRLDALPRGAPIDPLLRLRLAAIHPALALSPSPPPGPVSAAPAP